MRQKILFSILITLLFFAGPVFAISLVPEGTPLQPIPQNTGPGYNQNVNSDESIYSNNQRLELEQISPPQSPVSGEETPNPTGTPSTDSVVLSTEPIWIYWIMLIVGSLGLLGILGWLYWRFRQ